MVLDAEDGELPVDQTFHCSVVQIQVGQAEVRSSGDLQLLPRNDGEPVVLRRDLDRVPIEVADRVVPAVVPERKLIRLRAESPGDQLVAKTDSEDGNAPSGQPEDGFLRLFYRRGVTGTVGHEKPVRFTREDLGITVTRQPRWARRRGELAFTPKSYARTWNRSSPTAGTS